MFMMIAALAFAGQVPAAEAEAARPVSKASSVAKDRVELVEPGEYYLVAEMIPVVPGAPTEVALDEVLVRLGKNDVAGAVELQTKGSGYLFRPPLRVKVAPGVSGSRSAKYPTLLLARVAVVEGPFQGKESWVPRAALRPADGFPAKFASLAYAERVEAWRKDRMERSPGEEERPREGPASDLITKRRAKKAARYRATLAREAAEAQAQAAAADAARKEFKEMLPYMLEARGQELRRQTDLERNQIWNRFLNQGGAQGVIVGAPPQTPRVVNLPGQPPAN